MIQIEFKFSVSGITLDGKFNILACENYIRITAEFSMLILGSAYIEHNAFYEEKGCVITETS